jgi:chemotaxis family two-component system response regulator Rcp1
MSPQAIQTSEHAPITVLLVDDDPDCRTLLRDVIAQSHVRNEVIEASDAKAAMDYLHQREPWSQTPRPGLIYLDLEMPGTNGLELLNSIKSDPDLRDIPVVMLTGVSDETQIRKAAEFGANSYTIKPVDPGQFLRTLLDNTNYWLTIHQHPNHHAEQKNCRR